MGESYESIYPGAASSLDPDYGNFIGYRLSAENMGFPGSPQTANQLGETVNALKQGVKVFEVSMLGIQDADQAIPKQHFAEMRALMRLSGVKPSVHGPLIDAAGFGEKGWGGEEERANNERKMFLAIERAQELDPNGNLPIVFHSANGAPGDDFTPGDVSKGEERFRATKRFAINQENHKMVELKEDYVYRPDDISGLAKDDLGNWGKGKIFDIERRMSSANLTEWENQMTDLATFSKHADEVIVGPAYALQNGYGKCTVDPVTGEVFDWATQSKIEDEKKKNEVLGIYHGLHRADVFLKNTDLKFDGAFHDAFKYGNPEQKEELFKMAENFRRDIVNLEKKEGKDAEGRFFLDLPIKKKQLFDNYIGQLGEITHGAPPKVYEYAEDFAKEKASDTFGNLAIKSYEKFPGKMPVLAIENLSQGFAFSRADDLKELVDKSRGKFVDYLVGEKKMKEKDAKKLAEDKIGVTWDVGHLNMVKKKGFTEEDIIEETKKIAKDKTMVKHIHLTDNFGFGDSHLAPGMGNVPFAKILEELEKTGRLDEMKKIVEAGGMVQHFKKSPHPYTLSAFGSPIYSMKEGVGSYWNQALDVQGNYFGGYGTINPTQHHTLYGSGFTTMPVELGGQMPGGTSRFDGKPMT